jgi:LuxR family transcriptional regulator, maltose regulon positive regulatory protein
MTTRDQAVLSPGPTGVPDVSHPLLDLAARPPALGRQLVRRPGLVRALEAHEAGLVLIVAPAGYGKSTLLAEWAHRETRTFVWLSLVLPRNAADPQVRLHDLAKGLPELVCQLRSTNGDFIVVLDDGHVLNPSCLAEAVQRSMPEVPPGSAIVVASRSEPELPLGRLRAHRLVTELRTAELAMTLPEAAALLRRAGVDPPVEVVDSLLARTQGWPAALYLAGLALHEDADAAECFGGQHHLVSEYLSDEVLPGLTAEALSFALQSSVLPELSAAACDAVLRRTGSGSLLQSLAHATSLLEPLDNAHQRYQWHPLMREQLQAGLAGRRPDVERDLRRRAGEWLEEQGDRRGALDQAAAAGDAPRLAQLLWPDILLYLMGGEGQLVQDWLGELPGAVINAHPRLALSAGLAALMDGDAEAAERWRLAARDGLCLTPHSDEDTLSIAMAVMEAVTGHDAVDAMARLAPLDGAIQTAWQALCLYLAGVAQHLRGELPEAAASLERSLRYAGPRLPRLSALGLAQLGTIALDMKDWQLAADFTDRACLVAEEWQLQADPVSAMVFCAAAACRANDGRIDEAKRDLRCGLELVRKLDCFAPWYGAQARILLAHASLWLADPTRARTLLAEASRLARRTSGAVMFTEWFDQSWAYMDSVAETTLAGPSALTIAELRILRFLPSHRSFREIAALLGVSTNTVKTQAHAVYRKLGAASRSEAVEQAGRAGLLGQ